MTRFLASIALAAGLASAAQAQPAGSGADTFTARVRTADLNLASGGGLATLRGRVKAAADRYCGVAPTKPLADNSAIARCHAELARSADAQLSLAMSAGDSAVVGTR
jgi:UrcA family protein